jgi:hypothetical protein
MILRSRQQEICNLQGEWPVPVEIITVGSFLSPPKASCTVVNGELALLKALAKEASTKAAAKCILTDLKHQNNLIFNTE